MYGCLTVRGYRNIQDIPVNRLGAMETCGLGLVGTSHYNVSLDQAFAPVANVSRNEASTLSKYPDSACVLCTAAVFIKLYADEYSQEGSVHASRKSD